LAPIIPGERCHYAPAPVEYPVPVTGDASPGTAAGPAGRVGTSLPELVEHVAREYRLGAVADWSVLATGYEDCNIDLRTDRARVVVKVFAADRPAGVADRTARLIEDVTAAGVRHPRLHADAAGRPVHDYDRHRLLVMDFAPGHTFYDLGRPPDRAELARVVEQAARIHATIARPEPVFDSWAIANLVPLAGQVGDLLDGEQRDLVDQAIAELARVDFPSLPTRLIHADLTGGNVLLGPDGEITVLDFALANRWPRLQELAVIAASLLHGSPEPLPARMETVVRMYTAVAGEPLTPAEEDALPAVGRAAAAMELLGGLNQWRQGNRGPETDSLIQIGTNGLREYA
jgi:Ser/Thr protein kinase RdoA (MazF antagonist)